MIPEIGPIHDRQWYNGVFSHHHGRNSVQPFSVDCWKTRIRERKSKLKLNATGLAGVLVVGALTAGAFAAGAHFGPAKPVGHNLYHPAGTVAGLSGPRLLLASANHPGAMAQGARDGGPSDDQTEDFTSDGPGATFQQVYLLIKRHYVDAVPTDSKLGHGAASAMVASLQDPDSRFMEAPEMAEIANESKGQYRGIGAALAIRRVPHAKEGDVPGYTEYRLTVVAPLPGSPAEKAGLEPGDVITAINGQWVYNDEFVYSQTKALKAIEEDPIAFNKLVTSLQKKIDGSVSLADAQTKLDDPAAKTMSLVVTRNGMAQPLNLTLDTSAPTVVPAVASRSLPGGIGYIKINQFTPDADADFAKALTGFGNDPKGLVIDLRNSPGGLLEVGSSIATQLGSTQPLGNVETKGKKVTAILAGPPTHPMPSPPSCPISVLVNGGTANTAELLASVLQSKGAKLVGSATFGDASDVKVIQLKDGSGFTMTVGKLMTAAKSDFGGVGLKPDVAVPDAAGSDEPLNRAVGVLSGRVARIPSSRG